MEKQTLSQENETSSQANVDTYHRILAEIYQEQRKELFHIRKEKMISDAVIRNEELLIALSEVQPLLRQKEV